MSEKKTFFDQIDKITFDKFIRTLKGGVYSCFQSEMAKYEHVQRTRHEEIMRLLQALEKRFNAPGGDFLLQYMTLDELAFRCNLPRRKVMTLTTEGENKLSPVCTTPAYLFPRLEAEDWLSQRRRHR